MKINTKIIIPQLVMAVVAIVGISIVAIMIETENDVLEQAIIQSQKTDNYSQRLVGLEHETSVNVLSYRYQLEEEILQRILIARTKKLRYIEQLHKIIIQVEGHKLLADYKRALLENDRIQNDLIDAIRSGRNENVGVTFGRWSVKTAQIRAFLADVENFHRGELQRLVQKLRENADKFTNVLLIFIPFYLILVALMALYFKKTITNPLVELNAVVRRIASGNIDFPGVEIEKKYNDEIGELALSFGRLGADLKRTMVSRDQLISEVKVRKIAESELKKHQAELVQFKKMESLGGLTAGIAHNLNNYLLPIEMYGEILLKKYTGKSTDGDAMAIMLSSCKRASDLVKHLMAFSRQEEGLKSVQSIGSVIDGTLVLIVPTIPATAKVHLNLDGGTGDVVLNRGQIQSAVINLISNAVDALQENTGEVTINLRRKQTRNSSGKAAQSFASITVTDTGSGMDDETQEKMFDPFYTTKIFGKGTGLGLSTVFGTVTDHGGMINCSSVLGQGTTIEILLPLKEEEKIQERLQA